MLACVEEETVQETQLAEHELCLLRPVSENLEQKASDIPQQVWEGQEQLVEDLEDQGERLRALLEEGEALLEECRRAGRDVLEEVGQLRDVVDGMLEEIAVKLRASTRSTTTKCLRAAMAAEEPDYETLIAELDGDLQVVHTVPLAQVRPVVARWLPAITKEVKNLFAGTLTKITFDETKQMEYQGLVKVLPSKGVFAIKPPSERGDSEEVSLGDLWKLCPQAWRRRCDVIVRWGSQR